MINHYLKTDGATLKLLIAGRQNFIIQHDPKARLKVGEILSFSDAEDKRTYPVEFRAVVRRIETKHVVKGYAALDLANIDLLTDTELMGLGSLTAEQRAKLRKAPWVGVGLIQANQEFLDDANYFKKALKEWSNPNKKTTEGKRADNLRHYKIQLCELFESEQVANDFLERA